MDCDEPDVRVVRRAEPDRVGGPGTHGTLAGRIGSAELADEVLTVPGAKGCAGVKVTSVLGGMLAGADSIDDLDVLRHGAVSKLFGGVRAPSTLGTFLRSFRFGHVRQLDGSVWFGLIERQAIHRGAFGSVDGLNAKIRAFITGCNDRCHPFVWTKTADQILKKAKRSTTSETTH